VKPGVILSSAMDRAAADGIDSRIAIFGLLEMTATVLCLEDETTAIQEFEDCIQCFLTDWKAKADKIRLS
jgi:hypothetical protein